MTERQKIMNVEAHIWYVKKLRATLKAARQFLLDEGLKKVGTRKEMDISLSVAAHEMDQVT